VKAIRHCIDNGVRGIEHGNFVDPPTAKLMAEKGVYLTPTLIAYAQMASERWKNYLPIESQTKNHIVLKSGLEALRVASEAGVTMCYGSDLLGPLGSAQTHEFALRSQVLSSLEVLRSATVNPAKMMGFEHELGQIKEGFCADVVILNKNPLEDVTVFDKPDEHVLGVMKDGRVYKSRWGDLLEDGQIPVKVK
jgi:imidazolonepropionase-like amidohydrolase